MACASTSARSSRPYVPVRPSSASRCSTHSASPTTPNMAVNRSSDSSPSFASQECSKKRACSTRYRMRDSMSSDVNSTTRGSVSVRKPSDVPAWIGDHHRVVHEMRLAGGDDGLHRVAQQRVWCERRVDLEGQVRHDLRDVAVHCERSTGDAPVGGTQVRVRERIREHPVEQHPESAKMSAQLGV